MATPEQHYSVLRNCLQHILGNRVVIPSSEQPCYISEGILPESAELATRPSAGHNLEAVFKERFAEALSIAENFQCRVLPGTRNASRVNFQPDAEAPAAHCPDGCNVHYGLEVTHTATQTITASGDQTEQAIQTLFPAVVCDESVQAMDLHVATFDDAGLHATPLTDAARASIQLAELN